MPIAKKNIMPNTYVTIEFGLSEIKTYDKRSPKVTIAVFFIVFSLAANGFAANLSEAKQVDLRVMRVSSSIFQEASQR